MNEHEINMIEKVAKLEEKTDRHTEEVVKIKKDIGGIFKRVDDSSKERLEQQQKNESQLISLNQKVDSNFEKIENRFDSFFSIDLKKIAIFIISTLSLVLITTVTTVWLNGKINTSAFQIELKED